MSQKVIIVGAGISGLYAGYLLKAQGYEIKIIEAKDRIGGRILSFDGFSDIPVELGAGYVHGSKSLLVEYLDYKEIPLTQIPSKGTKFYYKDRLLSLAQSEEKKKLKKAIKFYDKVYHYQGAEQTAYNYFSQKKYFQKTSQILEGFASEYGTDLRKLGMKSLHHTDRLWHAGERDYVLPITFIKAFEEIIEEVREDILLNTAVTQIAYSPNQVSLTDSEGKKYQANKSIITVPLGVLKSRAISFSPTLPPEKEEAIQTLGFDLGMKVLLKFSKPFWENKTTFIFGGKACPSYEVISMGRKSDDHIICAYLMGRFAHQYQNTSQNELVELLISDLSEIFAQSVEESFTAIHIQDWSKEPYIWGAYSFDSPHSLGMRETLAMPIQDTIYFAGEAAHFDGHHATVHGAMEIAEWSVDCLIANNQDSISSSK